MRKQQEHFGHNLIELATFYKANGSSSGMRKQIKMLIDSLYENQLQRPVRKIQTSEADRVSESKRPQSQSGISRGRIRVLFEDEVYLQQSGAS